MRFKAIIAGVGMTRFGKHLDEGLKAIGVEAVRAALADAGIEARDLEAAYVGNAAAGLVTGQESIRGQVILRSMGIGRIPVVNVENACASASTALHQACAMVSAGYYDTVLALGVEKLYHPDKRKSFAAFSGAVDVEVMAALLEALKQGASAAGAEAAGGGGAGEKRSMFMDIYAAAARAHMQRYGTTVEQFAAIAAKNSLHGSLNPRAQFRDVLSVADVLAAPMVAEPLTRPMCSPIGDGAAAVVVMSGEKVKELGVKPLARFVTYAVAGVPPGLMGIGPVAAIPKALKQAGLKIEDMDVIELNEAFACQALAVIRQCPLPRERVNVNGGAVALGHPLGATGARLTVSILHELKRRNGRYGLVTMCIGGGMGAAGIFELIR